MICITVVVDFVLFSHRPEINVNIGREKRPYITDQRRGVFNFFKPHIYFISRRLTKKQKDTQNLGE